MNHKFNCLFFGTFITLFLIISFPVIAADSEENRTLKAIITELEGQIERADKQRVAHPTFLNELRALVEKYRSQLRELFFIDTFKDRNFNKNPRWVVQSGEFSVNKAGRLTSFVPMQMQPYEEIGEESLKQDRSLEAEAVGVLLDSIFGSKKNPEPIQNTPEIISEPMQPSYIYTKKVFPAAFEMNMKFKLSQEGETEIVLLGSKNHIPRYRLKIKANHSEEDPIEIVRETKKRSFVVGAGSEFPIINDGKFHVLTWIRLTDGAMNVLIDGNVVLKTYEAYYRGDFTGFGIANNGGSHEYDSFKIFKALKYQAN